jgi:hypothetical protein
MEVESWENPAANGRPTSQSNKEKSSENGRGDFVVPQKKTQYNSSTLDHNVCLFRRYKSTST